MTFLKKSAVLFSVATVVGLVFLMCAPLNDILVAVKIKSGMLPDWMDIPDLPTNVTRGIKKFVFFAGYARSGHSIIGALMDAHPHVVIAH